MSLLETAIDLGWWWLAIYAGGYAIAFFVAVVIESSTANPEDPSDHGGNSAAPAIALFWPLALCAVAVVLLIGGIVFAASIVTSMPGTFADIRQRRRDIERLTPWAATQSADPMVMLEVERMTKTT